VCYSGRASKKLRRPWQRTGFSNGLSSGKITVSTLFRTIELLALSLWLGSDVFLSFVVAPGAFQVLASRDQAGAIVGFALTRMHLGGILCGCVFLLASVVRTRDVRVLSSAPAVCVLVMMALTAVSQFTVSNRMAALRVQMGSIQATGEGSPLLAEFTRLHGYSVALESGVLLAGLAALYLMARKLPAG
jgi:uncharacterized membrane protein